MGLVSVSAAALWGDGAGPLCPVALGRVLPRMPSTYLHTFWGAGGTGRGGMGELGPAGCSGTWVAAGTGPSAAAPRQQGGMLVGLGAAEPPPQLNPKTGDL